MAHPLLPLMVTFAIASAHAVDLNPKSHDAISLMKSQSQTILARRDSPADGDDPHGDDPHDEQRNGPGEANKKLPARDHRDDYKAPQDPYGGQYPQGRAPY